MFTYSISRFSKKVIYANCSSFFQQRWNLFTYINHTKLISTNKGKIREWSSWKGIITGFVPLGICLVAVMQWRTYRKLSNKRSANQWEISFYCSLPLRTFSRCWGWLADKQLPKWIRPYMYGLYSFTFGVNLSEAANEDYTSYRSLADFFCRPLKDGLRAIDQNSSLVSPCDGTVLHFGTVNSGNIEQVKGVTYTLENFLGDNISYKNANTEVNKSYQNSLLHNKLENSRLYHCVIYLAPGDYHRFHSPTDWQPSLRRHFSGQLLSVNPEIARWLPGLFCINERAIYIGRWAYGFFSMAAIGATNVGSIKIYCDKWLQTNQPKYKQGQMCRDKCLGSNAHFLKGDPFGEFRMGSTIVLIFEAPLNFQFNLVPGQKVKMGESICCTTKEKHVDRVYKPQRTETINVS